MLFPHVQELSSKIEVNLSCFTPCTNDVLFLTVITPPHYLTRCYLQLTTAHKEKISFLQWSLPVYMNHTLRAGHMPSSRQSTQSKLSGIGGSLSHNALSGFSFSENWVGTEF